MTQAAAKTGVGPTVMVAVEQYFPSRQRLIIDDLAYSVLPFSARAFVWAMRPPLARNWMVRATQRAFPGLWSGIMCRKNVISMNRSSPYSERSVPSSISALVSIPAPTDYRPWPKSRCGKLINLRTSNPNRTVSANGLAGRLSISLPVHRLRPGSTWARPGFTGLHSAQADILHLGGGDPIPDRNGHQSHARLPCHGPARQPPRIHLRPEGLPRWSEPLRSRAPPREVCEGQYLVVRLGPSKRLRLPRSKRLARDRTPWL
jgi:hypothetical protein